MNLPSKSSQAPHKLFLLSFYMVLAFSINAQDVWSLQKCIEYARENNLTIKQAKYGVQQAVLTKKLNQQARYPSLSASSNGGFQFGRTIDPTTNSFNNERISFNSIRMDANVTLYNGGAINNSIRQGKYDLHAAEADAQFSFNTAALNIANAYLQILMAEEQLTNAEKRKSLSEAQLQQTDKMIQAGTLPENDRLEVLAQIARDEQTIIQSQNLIDLNYLNLKEFMQLDPSKEIKIEVPEVPIPTDADPMAVNFIEVYGTALNNQPQVERDEMRLKSAEMDVSIARANLFPSLVLFAGMDTRWSSPEQTIGFEEVISNETVIFEGNEVEIGFPGFQSVRGKVSYWDQLDQNFGQSVGLSLNVPIYSNGRNKTNIQRAEVGVLTAKLQSDLTKQQLKVDVQNAIAGARAALRTYQASRKTVEAAGAAFQNAEKQYQLGAINTFQYTTARNNLDVAEIDATVAKYDYLFSVKIVDFYLGKELNLD